MYEAGIRYPVVEQAAPLGPPLLHLMSSYLTAVHSFPNGALESVKPRDASSKRASAPFGIHGPQRSLPVTSPHFRCSSPCESP